MKVIKNLTILIILTVMVSCSPNYLKKIAQDSSYYEGIIYWYDDEMFFIFKDKLALSHDGRTTPQHLAYLVSNIEQHHTFFQSHSKKTSEHPSHSAMIMKIKGTIKEDKKTSKRGWLVSGYMIIEKVISTQYLTHSQFEKIMSM